MSKAQFTKKRSTAHSAKKARLSEDFVTVSSRHFVTVTSHLLQAVQVCIRKDFLLLHVYGIYETIYPSATTVKSSLVHAYIIKIALPITCSLNAAHCMPDEKDPAEGVWKSW